MRGKAARSAGISPRRWRCRGTSAGEGLCPRSRLQRLRFRQAAGAAGKKGLLGRDAAATRVAWAFIVPRRRAARQPADRGAGRLVTGLAPARGSSGQRGQLLEAGLPDPALSSDGCEDMALLLPQPASTRSRRIAPRWHSNSYPAAGTRPLRSSARRPSAGSAAAFRPGRGCAVQEAAALLGEVAGVDALPGGFAGSVGRLCLSSSAARFFSPRQ